MAGMISVGPFNQGPEGKPAVYLAELDTPGGTIHLHYLSELPPGFVRTRKQKFSEGQNDEHDV